MEMKCETVFDDVPSDADRELEIWQRLSQDEQDEPSGSCPVVVVPDRSWLTAFVLGTGLSMTPAAMAAVMPASLSDPSVEDLRPAVTVALASRAADQRPRYRKLLTQSFGHQAKEAMAALSLTKSQLAGVLQVSRPTIYEWLAGNEPNSSNATRLTTVLRLLTRAGISSESPLNARFVRHAIHERSASIIDLLSADALDEATIEAMLREAVALGKEAEGQRASRENRLRALGYEEPSPEQRRDQLNQTITTFEWPK
jgi:hypothetical protein